MRPTRLAAPFAAVLALLLPVPAGAGEDALDAAARKEITAAEAQKTGMLLAGPRFLGRGTGQRGNEDAAKWLAAQLKAAGYEAGPAPGGGDDGKLDETDYLQWFDVPAARAGAAGPVRTANVVGVLRGSGVASGTVATPSPGGAPAPSAPPAPPAAAREASRETVVLGAHFDHLGVRGGADPKKRVKRSGVFWGADDNGSGTTAALLVSRTLARLARDGQRPRRTIVVCFFTGEELGLLGSKHYVSAPVIPIADTVAMVNLDMVGRNATKYLEVYGNTSSPEVDAWHRKVLEETKFDCAYPSPALLQRSDQWSFYEAKVPVLFLHGGLHKDYHTPRDVPEELNYAKIALIARHAAGVLWLAANGEGRPTFREIDMKGAGGSLGVAVDPCTPEEADALDLKDGQGGVRVTTVFAGSRSEKLFQVGDLIYLWNGFPLAEDDPVGRFNAFVNVAKVGEQVVIRFLRGKERKAVTVKF